MNWKDIKNIIKEELKETEVKAGDNKFNLRMGVNRNKTKLGIKIQFEETGTPLTPDMKDKLEVALQERLNKGLIYEMTENIVNIKTLKTQKLHNIKPTKSHGLAKLLV